MNWNEYFDEHLYTRIASKKYFNKEITLYHGSPDLFKTVKPIGINFGNRFEKPSWSIFCFKEFNKAKNWAAFQAFRREYRRNIEKDGKLLKKVGFDCNISKGHFTTENSNYVFDRLLSKPIPFYVYEFKLPINEVGIGNTTHLDEYTVNKPINDFKLHKFILTKNNFYKYFDIKSLEELIEMDKEENYPDRGIMNLAFDKNFIQQDKEFLKAMYQAINIDKTLHPGDDIEEWMKLNGYKFNKTLKMPKLNKKLNEEYEPPMSLKEIKQKYGNDLYNKLKSDPVHKWRAKTGIELIHKEPSKEELERIMRNWESMDDKRKRISDKKSMEVFGCNNIDNYNNLIKTYDESVNFHIKVYHASKEYYKKLKSVGLDFGNMFQEEGFSLYTWTKYKSAIGWGCFEVLKTLKKIDENVTILGCKNSQNPIITKSVYNYLKDNLYKYNKKLLEFYIYTIQLNSDMELGLGHSSNTPNCITIRQIDDIDYSKVEKYQMTIDMLKKNCMIVDDNYIPTKKDIGVDGRLLTPFMTKDYMYQTSTKKQLSNDLKIGKLTPNDNLHDYLIDNNMELKKIRIKDRIKQERLKK